MITVDEYNIINHYRNVWVHFTSTNELLVSFDIKQVLAPIYLKYTNRYSFNYACGNCALDLMKFLFNEVNIYETFINENKIKAKSKR